MAAASSPSPPGTPSLRQRTTRGVMWVAAQAGATRIITLAQQIVLGWILAKSDFGLIGLAYTVSTLVALMATPGVDAVLVQRLRRYNHWATPAFWLGMAMGLVGAVAMLVIAPFAAWIYGRMQLMGLIAVLATALPIQALQIVPKAQLQLQMRFRAIVLLGLLGTTVTAVLTILLAYLGFGAYSFVVPLPIAAALVTAATWHLARPPIRFEFEYRRWKYLFGKSATVGVTQLLNAFINQADYMALGAAHVADSSIGAYMFGFNIAIQPLRLISSNVPVVLFPGLSHLALDRPKQVRATLRAMRLLTLVTVPVCMLQVLLAPPFFRIVLPPDWVEAVLPCQVLTVGLMFNAGCWPAVSLLLAQGRYRDQLLTTIAGTLGFVALLTAVGLWWPNIIVVASAVALFHFLYSPILHTVAVRGHASRASYFVEIGPPLVAGLLAAVPAAVFASTVPTGLWRDVLLIVAGGAAYTSVYAAAICFLVPASVRDLGQQLLPLWHRLRGTGATLADAAAESTMEAAAEKTIAGAADKMA